MSSYTNKAKSTASNQPSTSGASTSAASSSSSNEPEEPLVMSRFFSNILDTLNDSPSTVSVTSAPTVPYDIRVLPSNRGMPNPMGAIGSEYARAKSSSSSHPINRNEDNLSSSPGTSSTVSITCFRCDERSPTTRCIECNDLFCYDCCHKVTSKCQLQRHTLLPIPQTLLIGARPDSVNNEREVMECPTHGDPLKLFCKGCNDYICHKCTLWNHRDHDHSPIKGDFDKCRIEVMKILEDTRIGKKVIKASIDRAVAMLKAYEKDATEANMKIRNTMRYYTEFIEARKKYLIDKVEKMRQAKTTQLSDYTNTLRGMLAALAHTNDFLVQNMDSDGLRLFMANEKGRSQIDYFSTMFKKMTIDEERIVFISPYFDLVDLLRKFDVQRICAISGQVVNSVIQYPREAMIPLQSLQTAQPHRPLNYSLASTSSTTSPPSQTLCLKSYYCNNTSALNMELTTPTRGIGQAISGYWMPVSSKPIRNFVPGEPMFSFGREGQGQGQVSRPWGLCIDREGHIIVADRRNNRIQIFTKDGEFKTMFGSKGNGPGQFDLPAGIATDIFGRIIVVDKDNHRIQIFSMSGNFIFAFGSFGKEYGQFQYPWDVAVNTLGNIVVTDTRNHRIQLFTREGAYMNKYVFEGANSMKMLKGPTTPRGVCFTTSGNIIVSDFENHRLLLVDSTLSKVLQCVGCEGSGIGEFNRPSGIVTDDEGRVIVADSKNQRIVVLTSDLRILSTVYFKSPDLDDKDRPCDVALTPEGYMVVMFETLPDTARDVASNDKEYIKIY